MTISSIENLSDQVLDPRGSLSIFECPTSAKVERIACAIIGIALPIVGILSGSNEIFVLTALLSALSIGSISYIKDYDDPIELHNMRVEANTFSWNQLTNRHNLNRLPKLLSQREIREKFKEYYGNRPFSEILRDHSLSTIQKYELADFSQFSFLSICLVRELKQYPVLTLRKWSNNNWELEKFPYCMVLPGWIMEGLLVAKGQLEKADSKYHKAIKSLDYQYSSRFDEWKEDLSRREQNISKKVSQHGKEVKDSVIRAYADDIRNARTSYEENEIINERNRVAREAQRDAEIRERARLESEIFWERLDPIKNALAIEQQELYDRGVETANIEHSYAKSDCRNYVRSILSGIDD